MSLIFTVPGKTFLAGEYLALQGGPTLVFLSEPCFELEVQKGQGRFGSIHPESPAGKFIHMHQDDFARFDLKFADPYLGRGGFGASTAQFLSVYALWHLRTAPQVDMQKNMDLKDLLETYYQCAWTGEGQRPSGADLIGQYKGSLTFFEKRQGAISVRNWPFENLELFLIHTGNKLATHEHLRNLSDFDAASLEESFAIIRDSFESQNSELLIGGINSYAESLKNLNFTCPETLSLLEELRQIKGVVATKGCGALGADVVLVVTHRGESEDFKKFCADRHLSLLSSSEKISLGLQIRGSL